MTQIPIRKAIFPVAGMGTRFLPATKANPKEMLPIVDKPLIQYAVEEAVKAGITQIIFVTNAGKQSIENHFDSNYELEAKLEQQGREDLLAIVRNILPAGVSCAYVRQSNPLGLGHAVLCAKNLIGDEPFAVLLADDLIEEGEQGCLKQMILRFQENQSSIIAVERISRTETKKYGIIAVDSNDESSNRIHSIVEKPAPEHAPSNLAVVGRYILTPRIFSLLETTEMDTRGEIQLTDAISRLLREEEIHIYRLKGKRYDCGSKIGYLQATVNYALKHLEFAEEFKLYLQRIVQEESLL